MSTVYLVFKEESYEDSVLCGFDVAFCEMKMLAEDRSFDYTSIYKKELDSKDGKAAELVYTCTPVYTSKTIFEKGVPRQERTLTSLDIEFHGK